MEAVEKICENCKYNGFDNEYCRGSYGDNSCFCEDPRFQIERLRKTITKLQATLKEISQVCKRAGV